MCRGRQKYELWQKRLNCVEKKTPNRGNCCGLHSRELEGGCDWLQSYRIANDLVVISKESYLV